MTEEYERRRGTRALEQDAWWVKPEERKKPEAREVRQGTRALEVETWETLRERQKREKMGNAAGTDSASGI